jgi:glycosyltransferase involved in cell wall biosynthesis
MSSVSEPFGLTALEAAHHGNALIITRQSGVGEVLKNIFRYDFWDVNRLADQIVAIASSPALKNTLIDNVSKEYYLLSWTDVASKIMSHYNHKSPRRIYG